MRNATSQGSYAVMVPGWDMSLTRDTRGFLPFRRAGNDWRPVVVPSQRGSLMLNGDRHLSPSKSPFVPQDAWNEFGAAPDRRLVSRVSLMLNLISIGIVLLSAYL